MQLFEVLALEYNTKCMKKAVSQLSSILTNLCCSASVNVNIYHVEYECECKKDEYDLHDCFECENFQVKRKLKSEEEYLFDISSYINIEYNHLENQNSYIGFIIEKCGKDFIISICLEIIKSKEKDIKVINSLFFEQLCEKLKRS